MMAIGTTGRQEGPLRLGFWVSGNFNSPYAEGLFQYMTLLVSSVDPEGCRIGIFATQKSQQALFQWEDGLEVSHRPLIDIIAYPDDEENWPHAVGLYERDLDVWVTLRPDSPAAKYFTKPLVSIFADYIVGDFPTLFDEDVIRKAYEATVEAISGTTHYICFSNYVKYHQILKNFPIEERSVTVIPHAEFDYEQLSGLGSAPKSQAAHAIREFLQSGRCWRDSVQQATLGRTLEKFPFEYVPYVLMSTKHRPHKNANIILQAAIELRKKYENIKFITTAPIVWDEEDNDFTKLLIAEGLQWDVISIHHVPPKVHAALYRCASLVVHPSPFEGGAPFPLSEALSIGTPLLLADGPVIREALPANAHDLFLFNPTSGVELAERIQSSIKNRDRLLEKQRDTWRKAARPLRQNGAEFLDVCRRAARQGAVLVTPEAGEVYGFGATNPIDRTPNGWYTPDFWGRWSNSRRATFRFWRPATGPSSAELRLNVPPMRGTGAFTGWLMINGDPGARIAISDSGTRQPMLVRLTDLPVGEVTVTVVSDQLVRPCENDPSSTDRRMLGFGIEHIAFPC